MVIRMLNLQKLFSLEIQRSLQCGENIQTIAFRSDALQCGATNEEHFQLFTNFYRQPLDKLTYRALSQLQIIVNWFDV